MDSCCEGEAIPCAGDAQRNWREGLMLSVDRNTKSSTTLFASYHLQRTDEEPALWRDSWALNEQRTVFHRELQSRGSERRRHTVSGGFLLAQWHSWAVRSAFRRVSWGTFTHSCVVTMHSGSGLTHFFSYLKACKTFQDWLEPPLVLPSGTEMRGAKAEYPRNFYLL